LDRFSAADFFEAALRGGRQMLADLTHSRNAASRSGAAP
jgi:hypothetical protein